MKRKSISTACVVLFVLLVVFVCTAISNDRMNSKKQKEIKIKKISFNGIKEVLLKNRNVLLVDLIHSSYDEQMTIVSIQGVINKERPKMFLLLSEYEKSWLTSLKKLYGLSFYQADPEDIKRYFIKLIGKQIIYDKDAIYSVNLATSMAGLEQAVLTHTDLGIKTVFDCRNKWKNKIEAYKWAMRNIFPNCSKKALAYLDEEIPSFRDFIIKENLFTINLDPINNQQEINLLEQILDEFPKLTTVLGWASHTYADEEKGQNDVAVEHALVKILSKNNDLLVPADFARNLSLYGGIQVNKNLKQFLSNSPIIFDENKRYVTFIISDGDNIQYNLNHMRKLWLGEYREKVLLGWTISPQLFRFAPAILNIYYNEAGIYKTDEFVCGPSGYGYVNPGEMGQSSLKEFAKKTSKICSSCDISSVVILDKPGRDRNIVKGFLNEYAQQDSLKGIWLAEFTDQNGVIGKSVYMSEDVRGRKYVENTAKQINAIARMKRFIMVYVHAWEITPVVLYNIVQKLDPSIEVVLPFQLIELYKNNPDKMFIDIKNEAKVLNKGGSIELKTDGNSPEEIFYLVDKVTAIDHDHRFADGEKIIRYKFRLNDVSGLKVETEVANNFVIHYSFDNENYNELLCADQDYHDQSNRRVYEAFISVPPKYKNSFIYIRFGDGSVNDGWGASIWNLKVSAVK